MQIIGVDVGRNRVKAVSSTNRVDFPSVVGEWQERNLTSYGKYEVIIDGEKYFIGDLALRESYCPREMATESKVHLESKVLFLFMNLVDFTKNIISYIIFVKPT